MMLNNSVYQDKRILSSEWINISTKPLFLTYKNIGYYGMHWWVEDNFYFALGYGGQYIIVSPNKKMVIVITSEMYDYSLKPLSIMKESKLLSKL